MNSSACAWRAASLHRLVAGIGPAVEDVVADRAVQQRGVLRHQADLAAQRILRDVGDVLPVDEDAAALDVVEAQQQVDQRRLAGARAADQPDLLAGRDGQRQILDDPALAGRSGSGRSRSGSRRASPSRSVASGLSTRSCGRAMVSMPSCTVPTLSKMPIDVHMIQPDMVAMRIARPAGDGDRAERERAVAHSQNGERRRAADQQAVHDHDRATTWR